MSKQGSAVPRRPLAALGQDEEKPNGTECRYREATVQQSIGTFASQEG